MFQLDFSSDESIHATGDEMLFIDILALGGLLTRLAVRKIAAREAARLADDTLDATSKYLGPREEHLRRVLDDQLEFYIKREEVQRAARLNREGTYRKLDKAISSRQPGHYQRLANQKLAKVAPKGFPVPDASDLSKLGEATGKGQLSKAGHSLSKHATGKRAGSSAFPDPKGSPSQINQQAQNLLDDILNDPAKVVKQRPGRPGETLLQINRADGSGVIYKWDGTGWQFSHFAENLF